MKKHILKSNEDFNKIIKEGKKNSNEYFLVYSLPSLSFYNIGISVGKKLGDAHIRNRQKRIVRALIQNISKKITIKSKNYVVISRKKCLDSSFKIQEQKLLELFKKEN